jgi:hypothetical protein
MARPVCAIPVAQPCASIRVGVPVRRSVHLCQRPLSLFALARPTRDVMTSTLGHRHAVVSYRLRSVFRQLSPVGQFLPGSADDRTDRFGTALYPELRSWWKTHLRLSIVLEDTNLDNPQQSTAAIVALLDSLFDESSLIVGQLRIVAWCVTDPSGRGSHTPIMNERGQVGGAESWLGHEL